MTSKFAIVGSLDKASFATRGHYPEIVGYVGGIREELRGALARFDPERIAVNYSTDDPMSDGLTHGMFLLLGEILDTTPYGARLVPAQRIVAALRGRKSAGERERIRRACEVTTTLFDQRLTLRLRTGLTEKQVAALIREEMGRFGEIETAWDPEHCPAVFPGPDSAGAHAGPTDRPIKPGHIMNVDFGVRWEGYCSDLQRTWYFLRSLRAGQNSKRGNDRPRAAQVFR